MRLFRQPGTGVLLVCAANVCRSPMAEGVLRRQLQQRNLQNDVWVDSAGTHASRTGRAPDPRAQLVCAQDGIAIGKCRARQVIRRDFTRFDHILCMDSSNYEWLLKVCPEPDRYKIAMISSWLEHNAGADIPDPYFGSRKGFVEVYSMLRAALEVFVARELTS